MLFLFVYLGDAFHNLVIRIHPHKFNLGIYQSTDFASLSNYMRLKPINIVDEIDKK